MEHHVNGRRTYDASRRRENAAARRRAVLRAAGELFLSGGFATTTVANVARSAQVSPETVYKQFGGKSGLVRALHDEALRGEGALTAEERSDALRVGLDPHDVVHGWSRLAAEVAPRVAPLHLLVREAAVVDSDLLTLLVELDGSRHRRMTENAEFLASAGHLRSGVTASQAADLLWSTSSPEMYQLLVLRRGWSIEQYAEWVERTISGLLSRG